LSTQAQVIVNHSLFIRYSGIWNADYIVNVGHAGFDLGVKREHIRSGFALCVIYYPSGWPIVSFITHYQSLIVPELVTRIGYIVDKENAHVVLWA